MSIPYAQTVSKKVTPQTSKVAGKNQIKNSAGGYVFQLDPFAQLDRFLILGSSEATYYASSKKLTLDNLENLRKALALDGERYVNRIVEISDAGRAPKNDPALLALALALKEGNLDARRLVKKVLPRVARIPTHLFHFVEYVKALGGFGRLTKKAIASWYLDKPTDKLAEHMIKYQSRDGWSHADLIRLAHVKTSDASKNLLFKYAGAKYSTAEVAQDSAELPRIVQGFEKAKIAQSESEVIKLISDYNLSREMIPTEYLKSAKVQEAMLPHMGLTAMIRNLANMTRSGLIAPFSDASKFIVDTITDGDKLKKARVHPIAILAAVIAYRNGMGRSGISYSPDQKIMNALDTAFYASFVNVIPSNKNILLALDVSGSMEMGSVTGVEGLTPRVASAALALITAATEPNVEFGAFSNHFMRLNISPKMSLQEVINTVSRLPFSSTDCSLPMVWAKKQNIKNVDSFCIYTDNETYMGSIHPFQALKEYRNFSGNQNVSSVVVGMTATEFSIADPADGKMLDVVGFDTATPALISEFVSGK